MAIGLLLLVMPHVLPLMQQAGGVYMPYLTAQVCGLGASRAVARAKRAIGKSRDVYSAVADCGFVDLTT